MDLTQRKRAEERPTEQARLDSFSARIGITELFESMDEGYSVIEMIFDEQNRPLDYRFLEVNPAFEGQTGIKDAKGRLIREIAPSLEQHWFDIYARVALTGETVRFENQAAFLNSWYDVCAFRIGPAQLCRVGILFNNITERKQAEDAKSRLAAIVESSDDAIISKNLNGVIMSWNRGANRLFGYTAEEVIGKSITILMPAERISEEAGILERIRHGERIEHFETVRRRKDGTLVDIELAISPITDTRGRIVGASTIARDITDRKRSEEALRRLKDELEFRVEERTEELTQSHDRLRGLATELNLAEQRERKRLAAELHDHLQQLLVLGRLKLRQGEELVETLPKGATLISEADGILAEALTYTRTLVAELSPPVLRDHGLSAGLKWLGAYMHKHDMAVTVTVSEVHLQVPEDQALLLFQSVRELLMNAWKHAGTGKAAVTMELDGNRLRIAVHDDGRGFDLAAADPATSTKLASKFGLFSIRERMNALGGSFEIESAPNHGTTATLTLPLGAASSETEAEPTPFEASPEGSGAPRARPWPSGEKTRPVGVLLVDDHAMVRQGLRTMLESYADVEVVGEACDGEEALVCTEQLNPAVVVMDINMPKMNGIEATARLKARYPDITIIGLSVNAGEENQQAMKKAGATSLITKEAAVEQLYAVIQETSCRGANLRQSPG